MRQQIVATMVVLLLVAVAGNAWGAVQYTVTDLHPTGIDCGYSNVEGFNNKGQAVVNYMVPGGTYSFRYDSLNMTKTELPSTFLGRGINDSGQIAGTTGHPAIYDGSTVTDLSTLGGRAYKINSRGWAVGVSDIGAFIYKDSTMIPLGTLGGTGSVAWGVNANGWVVGESSIAGDQRSHAFLHNGSTMIDLFPTAGTSSTAESINDNGLIVGTFGSYGFVTDGVTTTELRIIDGALTDGSNAFGINNKGQVVGLARIAGAGRAFLYEGSTMTDLNTLIDPESGWYLKAAGAINETGQIVGIGTHNGEANHAFLLTPVPEASTFVLLGMGAAGLLAFGWRRKRSAVKRWTTGSVRSLVIGCLVVTTLTANARRGRAESVTFDFSSGPGPNFTVLNDGSLWTVSTGGPDLRISKPADDGTLRPAGRISGGISSGFVLDGDFTVTVDFTLYNFPGAGGWERLNESILSTRYSDAAHFWALRFRNNEQDSVEGWSVPTGGTFGLDTTVTSGRYRISRSGSTMMASYAPEASSSFTSLGGSSNAAWLQPMHVELLGSQGISNLNATRSTTAMDIGFDNLVVQADSISGLVPEPSTLVLLGMGAVGLLGLAWRRRKQAA